MYSKHNGHHSYGVLIKFITISMSFFHILDFTFSCILVLVMGLRTGIRNSIVAEIFLDLGRLLGLGIVAEQFVWCAMCSDVFAQYGWKLAVRPHWVHSQVPTLVADKKLKANGSSMATDTI
jgi:hypothetical protein